MSYQALDLAAKVGVGTSAYKLVLTSLALFIDSESWRGWSSLSTLAEHSRCSARTVARAIKFWAKLGFIKIYNKKKEKRWMPNEYEFVPARFTQITDNITISQRIFDEPLQGGVMTSCHKGYDTVPEGLCQSVADKQVIKTSNIYNNTHYAHAPTRVIDSISEPAPLQESANNENPSKTHAEAREDDLDRYPTQPYQENKNSPQNENLEPCSKPQRVYDNHGSAFIRHYGGKTPDDVIDPQFEEYKNIFPRKEKLESEGLKILWRGLTAEQKKLALADVKRSSAPDGRWADLIENKIFHKIPMPDNYLRDERWKDKWHARVPEAEKPNATISPKKKLSLYERNMEIGRRWLANTSNVQIGGYA